LTRLADSTVREWLTRRNARDLVAIPAVDTIVNALSAYLYSKTLCAD